MLEIKNASLAICGKPLFSDLSFCVNDGDILCITGPSGCGKTSILKAIMGFLPLDKGFISIDGELVSAYSAETFRRRMAYVPQEVALPYDEVSDMIQAPFSLRVNSGKHFSKKALMIEWQKLGLDASLYDKKTSEVSGGERQRIMLSVIGLLGKNLILVDEPTAALDSESSRLVSMYFRTLAQAGAIVIAVSHDEAFAEQCDKRLSLIG